MKDEYPTTSELKQIKDWDINDFINLLSFIEDLWWSPDWGFKMEWGKDRLNNKRPVILLELHTGGWSGNEDIIYSLLENRMFKSLWYTQWNRGGHYRFEINPYSVGFESANELAKKAGISRQAVHKSDKYEKLKVSQRVFLFREKAVK